MSKLSHLFSDQRSKDLFAYFARLGSLLEESPQPFLRLVHDPFNDASVTIHTGKIEQIEHDADETVAAIFELLGKTSFLPFDHEDVSSLVIAGDDVIDALWAAANNLGRVYGLSDPDQEMKEMAVALCEACALVGGLLKNLRNLRKAPLLQIIKQIHELENQTDKYRDAITRRRYQAACESSNPRAILRYMAWEKIAGYMERAADRCEDIMDILGHFPRKYFAW